MTQKDGRNTRERFSGLSLSTSSALSQSRQSHVPQARRAACSSQTRRASKLPRVLHPGSRQSLHPSRVDSASPGSVRTSWDVDVGYSRSTRFAQRARCPAALFAGGRACVPGSSRSGVLVSAIAGSRSIPRTRRRPDERAFERSLAQREAIVRQRPPAIASPWAQSRHRCRERRRLSRPGLPV